MLDELSKRLMAGGIPADTAAAIVYKATWPEEKSFICTVANLGETGRNNGITKTAIVLVGDIITHANYDRSKLYDPDFTTEYRR